MPEIRKIKLILKDGSCYEGRSFGYPKSVSGEVVFNTAMTGYPESLTDPSYKGQILVSTYPLVGNYGVPERMKENGISKYFESDKIHVTALIISDYSFKYSHWNAQSSLADWLKENKIPGIFGIDTRALTKRLREKGAMLGKIIIDDEDTDFYDPNQDNLVNKVSVKKREVYVGGEKKVILIDCGVKNNIVRCLLKRDFTVIKVPWDYDFLDEDFDGVVISNGPGNPESCDSTINHLKKLIERDIPIFGICLGNQLLGLASGGKTYKLKYGHRGHNQPVLKAGSNKCFITSQNHGFALDNNTLSGDWEPYFINVNDGTNEGIKHKFKPFFTTQFHPEASSGPRDTEFLFDDFKELINKESC